MCPDYAAGKSVPKGLWPHRKRKGDRPLVLSLLSSPLLLCVVELYLFIRLSVHPCPVIDRDMISGLTGTGTEIINLPGPGPIISILPGPGPGPTIQFYRDDRDDRDLTGMTGTKTGILILKAA